MVPTYLVGLKYAKQRELGCDHWDALYNALLCYHHQPRGLFNPIFRRW